jgi:tetratricopeptide (TPR) repeat protein
LTDPADRRAWQAALAPLLLCDVESLGRQEEGARMLAPLLDEEVSDQAGWGLLRWQSCLLHSQGNRDLGGQPGLAERSYREALAIRERLARHRLAQPVIRLDLSATRFALGRALERQGRNEEALSLYRSALEAHREACQAEPENAQARRWLRDRYRELCGLLVRLDRLAEAEKLARQGARECASRQQ